MSVAGEIVSYYVGTGKLCAAVPIGTRGCLC